LYPDGDHGNLINGVPSLVEGVIRTESTELIIVNVNADRMHMIIADIFK
jgi:hypothetical protein